jgi:lipoprotein
MKKTLSYLALCFVAATVAGCQTEDADPFGGTASVRIEKTGHQNPSEFEVRFTPSDNSVSYRYAIGDESDFGAFRAGTLPGSMTVADGHAETVLFKEIQQAATYTVFAVAADAFGHEGSIASLKVRLADDVSVTQAYLLDCSAGFTVRMASDYRGFRYYLGTAADRDKFVGGQLDDGEINDLLEDYTVNYFELAPATDYVFYVEVIDRAGNSANLFEQPFRTLASDEAPGAELTYQNDIYKGTYTLSPNRRCGKISALVQLKSIQDEIFYHRMHWKGDLMTMLERWESLPSMGMTVATQGLPAEMELVTPTLTPANEIEVYALIYDTEGVPAGVRRYDASTPAINPDAPRPSVSVTVSDITTSGATYTYLAAEGTFAFMYDTVDADWFDEIKKSEEYTPTYLHNLFYTTGGKWAYNSPKAIFTETAGKPGKRYYAVGCPMNCNGPLADGWGEMAIVEYTTLTE